jgi:hypothetical protein
VPRIIPQTTLLSREFLEIRSRLIDIAAALDRIERNSGEDISDGDPRFEQVQRAVRLLSENGPDRAARVQMVFSDPFDAAWRSA